MRLLHTSDWHLGRALHGHDLLPAQAAFADHLVEVARTERVDAVLVSGDVHDRALPPVEALQLLDDVLSRLRAARVPVVLISGNHDAPSRLGDKAGLLDPLVSVRTDPARVADPVLLEDRYGEVAVYAVPYLEPTAVRDRLPGADGPEAAPHTRVLARALRAVSADRAQRGGRSVVLAHAWVSGGDASPGSERDISVGGVAHVPAALFGGLDYVALGHLHRPQALTDGLRYSGSPVAYSFGEAGVAKSSWLVELGPAGLIRVEAVPVPVHRRLARLRGPLERLLVDPALTAQEDALVSVELTDAQLPVDAMAALQRRFPHALHLQWVPEGAAAAVGSYGVLVRGRSDLQVAEEFVVRCRGSRATDDERLLLREALEDARRCGDASLAAA